MKSKLFSIITTALFAAALLVTAIAQNPSKIARTNSSTDIQPSAATVLPQGSLLGKQVKLPCQGVRSGDIASFIRVTNNTGSTIPTNTLIFFSTSNGPGKQALDNALANGGTRELNAPPGSAPNSCEAWYFKN